MKLAILKLVSSLTKIYYKIKGVKYGSGFFTCGLPHIFNKGGKGSIQIGDNVTIHSSKITNASINARTTLITSHEGARIIIGDNVGISGTTILSTNRVTIGAGTIIGFDALLLDDDMHEQAPDGTWETTRKPGYRGEPITIGKNCFIGARAIILKGVTIGDSCIVGTGAVVYKNMPDHTLALGNPAIIVPR